MSFLKMELAMRLIGHTHSELDLESVVSRVDDALRLLSSTAGPRKGSEESSTSTPNPLAKSANRHAGSAA